MRDAFIDSLIGLAEEDDRIHLITADFGYSVLEKFQEKFPERFLNVGIAEQNMIGFATGLALMGKNAYVYTQIPFLTLRCLDQVRNDLCYQGVGVKMIGLGSGYCYGTLGVTHHAIEDIGILRSLPNIVIISPGDPIETEKAVTATKDSDQPVYIRIARRGEPAINPANLDFKVGKANVVAEGDDTILYSTGDMLQTAMEVREILSGRGFSCGVVSMHTLKPFDTANVLDAGSRFDQIFSVEEHNVIGGLGSALAEAISGEGCNASLTRFGVPDEYVTPLGKQDYIRRSIGLDAGYIAGRINESLGR
ncbi:MAG: hypothetical protein GF416_00750 [Candidatus Altiarchaeales archaeon]|nr:hypothetical protein [Candidatus Altiarchaeales archaeon]MBD3415646.1 hypothetical protein [Candidatus Altiarchaeales archaeon]